jgi:MFS-type transporter involved in bile tolerance (Atg22 family)
MIKKISEDLTNYVPNNDAYEEGAVGCLMRWLVIIIIIIIKRQKIYFLIIFSVLLNLNKTQTKIIKYTEKIVFFETNVM